MCVSVIFLRLIFQDIQILKPQSTTRELAQSLSDDQAFASIFDTIVDAVIIIDQQGIVCGANPATTTVLGYPLDELIGQNVSKVMPEPYRSEHDQYLQKYRETGKAEIIGIGRRVEAVHKNGNVIPIDLAVSEFQFKENRYFTGVLRDISERVKYEEQLRKERDFSTNLIDTAHAIILVLSPDGSIERFNPYLEELTGFSLDDVIGADWFEKFIPTAIRSEIREVFDRTLAGKPVLNNVNAIMTKDGRERVITWSGRRLLNLEGEVVGVLAVGNDVTELKEAERKLVQSERLAAIGEMVAGLAHESRNALQRSQASLEMLALDLEGDQEKNSLINRIQRALQELQRLYEEVRNYAAPIQLDVENLLPERLIQETWLDLCGSHPHDIHRLRITDESNGQTFRGDQNRIQQVIRNVLDNSVAMAPASSILNVHIEKSSINGARAIGLRFCDQGPGFDTDQIGKVFEPFYTTKSRGTGLGLAISRRIVEAHKGQLTAANHSRGGAMIKIVLPISN